MLGYSSERVKERRALGSLLPIVALSDELFERGEAVAVAHLFGRVLHHAGGGGEKRTAQPAVEAELGAADGVDDYTR